MIFRRFCKEEQKNPEYKYEKLKKKFNSIRKQTLRKKSVAEGSADSIEDVRIDESDSSSGAESEVMPLENYGK